LKEERRDLMKSIAIVAFLALALYAGNAGAVEFKLGEFNITMNPPATVDHISYGFDPYDDIEVNTATIKDLFLTYKVTILKSLSKPVEEFKSTPIPGYYDSLTNIEMDGKPAVMILANKFTTVEYVKDDKALITLRFEEAEGTDSSNSIATTIKSFKATRA
jgi:hypothetical protein